MRLVCPDCGGIGEGERITGAALVDDPRRGGRFVEVG